MKDNESQVLLIDKFSYRVISKRLDQIWEVSNGL